MVCRVARRIDYTLDNRDSEERIRELEAKNEALRREPAERVICSPSGFYHVTYDGKERCECAWEAEQARLREIVRARGRT